MNKRTNYRIITGIIILILFVYYILMKVVIPLASQQAELSQKIIPEYQSLFTREAQQKLQVLSTVERKTRSPVTTYAFDDKFNVYVFRLLLTTPNNLTQIFEEKNASTPAISVLYSPLADNKFFKMGHKIDEPDSIIKINFAQSGKAYQRLIYNDSLACYYLKLGSFAIGYNDDDKEDISGNAESQVDIPVSILFFKKNLSLYVIIMKDKDDNRQNMSPSMLTDIIKH